MYTPRDIIETIVSDDQDIRNRSIEELLSGQSTKQLLVIAREIETFRECSDNLYQRVRAALFLFFLYRFYLMDGPMLSLWAGLTTRAFSILLTESLSTP